MHCVTERDENSLRLTGNQIKLTVRPLDNNSTASSRCALLRKGYSRPLSAVPLLNLNYNEFDHLHSSRKRPLSADFPLSQMKNLSRSMSSHRYKLPATEDETSVESSEDTDGTLQSSDLLQSMLTEPLYSWRNGVRSKPARKHKIVKKPVPILKLTENSDDSTESDANSSLESRIKHNREMRIKPETIDVAPQCQKALTKNNTVISTAQTEIIDAKNPAETKPAAIEDANMKLLPGLKTKPPLPKKPDLCKMTKANDDIDVQTESNFEKISSDMLSYNLKIHQEQIASTTTLESENDSMEVKFQNWFLEEQKVTGEIIESEFNTDLLLHKLKQIDKEQESTNDDSKQPVKNFIKENIKLSSKRNAKVQNNINFDGEKLKKFVPTQMKSFTDYKERNECEIESWMSSSTGLNTVLSPKPSKPNTYLDFLNQIDEIQETCGDIGMEELESVCNGGASEMELGQKDGNTYDDIISILKVLEEQDKKSQMKMESLKEIVNTELLAGAIDSCISNESDNQSEESHGTPLKELSKKHQDLNNCYNIELENPRDSLNSSTNLNDIFSYLDEVDRKCAKSLACAKERIQSATQVLENNIQLDTIPKLEELLAYTSVELSQHVIDLSLRLKEKSSSISLLQKELSSLRQQVTKMTKDTNEIVKQRLKTQKEDCENVVKRHQKFIDQLINDKKTLNQQCESLLHEMKILEDRYSSNIKAAEHKHKIELQKVKEMHTAGEKIRRERWIDTKTQKIKELTVKGLEPELEKMASRHQQELTDLRSLHKREIEELDLRATRKLQQHCETLREQLTIEREKALTHERELLRQRYEHMVESEETNYQEQRRKLLAEQAKRISECEERENSSIMERDRGIKQAQIEFEDKIQAAMRRHTTELTVLKEKTEIEMESFRNTYKKQAAVQIAEKETQIREKYRKERDKEIEAVIERLEIESSANKTQIEQTAENRIRRLKDKYEKEINDVEGLEREATSKCSETKARLLETEEVVMCLKSNIKQLEKQLQEAQEISEKFINERANMKGILNEEMKHEVAALEKELQELKNDKDKELHQVYARVKVAVARKDEALTELTRDHTALQEKCAYLENMLEQQRKDYLIK